jgi:hypothetical protein
MKTFKIPTKQKCFYCQAGCCSDVVIEIDADDFEDFDNMRWYLYHNDVFVYLEIDEDNDDEEEWHVGFRTRCGQVQPDNSCGVYAKRPQICRDHSPVDCSEYTGPGADKHRNNFYDAFFDTGQALDEWLLKNGREDMIRPEDEKGFVAFENKSDAKDK